ncbi:MAG TPA: tetratricopeptide repeat protein, partial [Gemmataceae bacterium]|nr:tetratricopeptide repeat protein [Gemmataceae bacterium]
EKFRRELVTSARQFYQRFIDEQFDVPSVRYDLALAYQRLADIDHELGDNAAAEQSSTQAVALLRDLADAQPDVPDYRRDLAASYMALGQVYVDLTNWEKAEAAFEQAISIQEQQAATFPGVAEYSYALAKSYGASGHMHYKALHLDRATTRLQQALDVLNKVRNDARLATTRQILMEETQLDLGQIYIQIGAYDRGELALREALRISKELAQNQADPPPERWEALAKSTTVLGVSYRMRLDTTRAEAVQQDALKIFDKLASEHRDVPVYTYDLGRCYTYLADTASWAGRPKEALERFDKGIGIIEEARHRGYKVAEVILRPVRIDRFGALAACGEHARATAAVEELVREGNLKPNEYYDVCCVWARALTAAGQDTRLSAAERTHLQAHYADRAMYYLRQAITKGWPERAIMRIDPDLQTLRTRSDFRELMAELARKPNG